MLVLALVLLAASPNPQRLVTGTGLRVRAAPDANAAIVEKIALGSVLACMEESKPVTVGGATASFCKMERGWYFTALTEPVESDATAQLDRLIDKRAGELGEGVAEDKRPDVYQVHTLMLRRIEERKGVEKLRARLAELAFVAKHADAFHKDPRVVGDDSQGPRVKNEAFEKLVKEAKGTAVHEDAAFALYQHGMGGECEGYAPCVYVRALRTACTFLAAFPEGERAQLAVMDIIETVESQTQLEATGNPADPSPSTATLGPSAEAREARKEASTALVKLRRCVEDTKTEGKQRALDVIDAAIARSSK